MDFKLKNKCNSEHLFCRFYSLLHDVQCAKSESVYLPQYHNILLSRPRGIKFGFLLANIFTLLPCIAFFMISLQCLAYPKKHIIVTRTIHLYPFQQKLYRLTFLSIHDTEVAIMVINILIISKKISAVYLKTP